MNEPALTEAVKTDLPSPKPNRRKHLALRFAVLVVAVSVLGAAYWFTRPPELVWWRSPEISNSRIRARVLIPRGWEVEVKDRGWMAEYSITAVERRPMFLRWIFPRRQEAGNVDVQLFQSSTGSQGAHNYDLGILRFDIPGRPHIAQRTVIFSDHKIAGNVFYSRWHLPAFNRTYRQICNSLRIE